MNTEDSRTDLGTIRIHKKVIASISSLAASEIEGVKGIASKKLFSAISVEINKNEEAKVEIPLIIKYGYNIPEVASKVQENVRNNLEKMTNLSIKDININVQGIERG